MKVVEGAAAPLSIHLLRIAARSASSSPPSASAAAIVLLLAWAVTALLASNLNGLFQRERPYGIVILGTWSGYSHPSLPIVALAAVVVGVCLVVVPRGWPLRVAQVDRQVS